MQCRGANGLWFPARADAALVSLLEVQQIDLSLIVCVSLGYFCLIYIFSSLCICLFLFYESINVSIRSMMSLWFWIPWGLHTLHYILLCFIYSQTFCSLSLTERGGVCISNLSCSLDFIWPFN